MLFSLSYFQLSAQSAYFFDGQDDYIEAVNDGPQSNFTELGYTVEFIFQVADAKPDQVLLSQVSTVTGQPFIVGLDGNNRPYTKISGQTHLAEDFPLETGACYHLSLVYDWEEIYLYLNGQLEHVFYRSAHLPELDENASFFIGRYPPDESSSFLGTMDEVRIFSNKRTANEIGQYAFLPLDIANDHRFAYYDFHDNLGGTVTTDPYYFNENMGFLGGQAQTASAMPQFSLEICMQDPPESLGSPFCNSFQWSCNAATVTNPAEMLCNGNFEQYCNDLNNPPSWAIPPHAFNAVGSQGVTGSDVVNWEQTSINTAAPGIIPLIVNSTPDFYVKGGLGTNGTGFNLQDTILINPPANTHNGNGNAFTAIVAINKPPTRRYMEKIRTRLKNGQSLQPNTTYTFSGWFYKSAKGGNLPPNYNNDPGKINIRFSNAARTSSYFADSVVIQDASQISSNNGWQLRSFTFTTPGSLPGNLDYMEIENRVTSTIRKTYIYIDDLSLIDHTNFVINPPNEFPQYIYTGDQNDFWNRVIKTDPNDNVYAALGIVNDAISGQIGINNPQTFATNPADTAKIATLMLKYDNLGNLQWSKLIPNVYVTDFDFTANDDVFVTGYTQAGGFGGTDTNGNPFSNSYFPGGHINYQNPPAAQTLACGPDTVILDEKYNENIYIGKLDRNNGNLTLSNAYGHHGEEKGLGVRVINNIAYISTTAFYSNDSIPYRFSCNPGIIPSNFTYNWAGGPYQSNQLLKYNITTNTEIAPPLNYFPEETHSMARKGDSLYFVDYEWGVGYSLRRFITNNQTATTVSLNNDPVNDMYVDADGSVYLARQGFFSYRVERYIDSNATLSYNRTHSSSHTPIAITGNDSGVYVFYLQDTASSITPTVLGVNKIDTSNTTAFGTPLWHKESAGNNVRVSDLATFGFSNRVDAVAYHDTALVAFLGDFLLPQDSTAWEFTLDNKILQSTPTTPLDNNGHTFIATVTDLGSTGKFKKNTPAPDIARETDWQVYPNPTRSSVVIEYPKDIRYVQLSDLTGKVVHSQAYHGKQVDLDLSHLRAGAYLLLVKSENETHREKLLVQ